MCIGSNLQDESISFHWAVAPQQGLQAKILLGFSALMS